MEEIKQVIQLDKYGCTIACMAMILDMQYFDLRKILHEKIDRLTGRTNPEFIGLNCGPMKDALETMFDVQCRFIKFESLGDLRKHCILFICPLGGCYVFVHTVIYDAQQKRLIDPDQRDTIASLENYNVVCCLEIQ